MNKKLTTNCGDWHLGWGYGITNKLGKLTYAPDTGIFEWKGWSQGRHGQKWNKGAWLTFKLVDNKDVQVIESKGSYPIQKELVRSAQELIAKSLEPEKPKRKYTKRSEDNSSQLKLDL